jgi:regulator of RNase E activity RraB
MRVNRPQLLELREDFGVSFDGIGTCFESLLGGNHLR